MLRRAARRLNPLWAYREEKARKLHPGNLQDEQWGWVYAPTSAALYSVAWQLALVTGLVGLTVLMTSPGPGSVWRDLLIGGVIATFGLLFAGALAEVPLVAEAVRRRRWGMIMVNIPGMVVLLRAVDYAFGPRRPFHPHPRFVPGKLGLGSGVEGS
jgi:hypothetical protein